MKRALGFTLIELIIVLAIIGILAAIGFSSLRRDHFQVKQAARSFVTSVQKARFEAISQNTFGGIRVKNTGFEIFTDTDAVPNNGGETVISTVPIGSGDYVLVSIPNANNQEIVFTPRGTPLRVSANFSVNFTSARDSTYIYRATASQQGNVRLEKQ